MTSYEVEWVPETVEELARLWLRANDHQAITSVEASINRQLIHNPHAAGTHLSEGLYRLVVRPVGVVYSISESDRRVEVSGVFEAP